MTLTNEPTAVAHLRSLPDLNDELPRGAVTLLLTHDDAVDEQDWIGIVAGLARAVPGDRLVTFVGLDDPDHLALLRRNVGGRRMGSLTFGCGDEPPVRPSPEDAMSEVISSAMIAAEPPASTRRSRDPERPPAGLQIYDGAHNLAPILFDCSDPETIASPQPCTRLAHARHIATAFELIAGSYPEAPTLVVYRTSRAAASRAVCPVHDRRPADPLEVALREVSLAVWESTYGPDGHLTVARAARKATDAADWDCLAPHPLGRLEPDPA